MADEYKNNNIDNNNDIIIDDNSQNAIEKKEAKRKNFINIILVIVGLFVIFSILFTYFTNKNKGGSALSGDNITAEVVRPSLNEKRAISPFDNDFLYLYPLNSFDFMYIAYIPNQTMLASWSDGSKLLITYDLNQDQLLANLVDINNNSYLVCSWLHSSGYTYVINVHNANPYCVVNAQDFVQTSYSNISVATTTIGLNTFFSTSPATSQNYRYYIISSLNNYEERYIYGIEVGQQNVINSPNDFDLYTSADLASAETTAFRNGYDRAEAEYANEQYTLKTLIFSVLEAPSKFISGLNFELFGIDFRLLISFILMIGLVIFVVGLFKRN